MAKQLLDALSHLHKVVKKVHGLISPECFVWCDTQMKLTHWPINLLTNGGDVLGASSILPTDLTFVAPEKVKRPELCLTPKSDIWSAGLTLLKLIKPDCKLSDNPCRLAFCDNSMQVIEQICGQLDDSLIENSTIWNQFFQRALDPNPDSRADLEELYKILDLEPQINYPDQIHMPLVPNKFELQQESVSTLNISEIYYLWRLSIGRNFESEQKQDCCPPIFKIPHLIVDKDKVIKPSDGPERASQIFVSTKPKSISLDIFKQDISRLDESIFYPLILTDEELLISQECRRLSADSTNDRSNIISATQLENEAKQMSFESITFADLDNLSVKSNLQTRASNKPKSQPVVIKEADFAYQCERIVLYKRLLTGCPFLKEQLKLEAHVDIPPYYRAQTWAILLDVDPKKSKLLYDSIDKCAPLASDKQINVDVPRCHQYNELMASPVGHEKLKRILKAWLIHNKAEYVYWQGLDSLAAPFLLLNFDNESLAFGCFNAFIDKYLRGFFIKDNQLVVQQYLAMFTELLSFHEHKLASHLKDIGFLPNLYAIPWFLTLFTHVLPLHKILHLWDHLLLGDEKYPLYIGLAILIQLKDKLMNYSFNDCIVAFSDLPEIDIQRCIRNATLHHNLTPDVLFDFKKDC